MATRCAAARQIERDACVGGGVADLVAAQAAVEDVATGAADQGVVAAAADQGVRTRGAGQRVGVVGADDVLDIGQAITGRRAARGEAGGEVDGDRRAAVRVDRGVDTVAAVQGIRADAAGHGIVAVAAVEAVVGGAAGEDVGVVGADHAFEAADDVTVRVTAGDRVGGEIDGHAGGGAGVVQDVLAAAAEQRVGARAALDGIVAGTGVEPVGAAGTGQGIGKAGADRRLEVGDHVAGRVAAGGGVGGQVDGNAGVGAGVVDRVGAVATVQGVRVGAAGDGVVAVVADEEVGAGAAGQQVGVGGAEDALDGGERVAGGIAAGPRRRGDVDGDGRGGLGVVGHVGSGAAAQHVGSGAADKGVVAEAAEKGVVAVPTGQDVAAGAAIEAVGRFGSGEVVGVIGTNQVLDVGEGVAGGVATGPDAGGEIDRDARGAAGIAGGIGSRAALEGVRAGTADEGVVAAAAGQAVGARGAGQRIARGRADRVFDVDEHVTVGVAAGSGSGVEIDGHGSGRGRIVGGVGTAAPVEGVGPGKAGQHVVARVAAQRVGVGAAFQVLEAQEGVAGGKAARGRARIEVDRDGVAGLAVGKRVAARAAVEGVRAGARRDEVVARPGGDLGPGRRLPENVGGQVGDRIDVDGVSGVIHVADGEAHRAGGCRADPCGGVEDDELDGQVEGRVEAVRVGDRGIVRHAIGELECGRVRIRGVERQSPGVADPCRADDREAGREAGDAHAADRPAGVRHLG